MVDISSQLNTIFNASDIEEWTSIYIKNLILKTKINEINIFTETSYSKKFLEQQLDKILNFKHEKKIQISVIELKKIKNLNLKGCFIVYFYALTKCARSFYWKNFLEPCVKMNIPDEIIFIHETQGPPYYRNEMCKATLFYTQGMKKEEMDQKLKDFDL